MVNKKILINLFEERMNLKGTILSHSYQSGPSSSTLCPQITFLEYIKEEKQVNEVNEPGEYVYQTKLNPYSDCTMQLNHIFETNDFYITFNNIKLKITISEYNRLNKMFEKIYNFNLNDSKKKRLKKDLDLSLITQVYRF